MHVSFPATATPNTRGIMGKQEPSSGRVRGMTADDDSEVTTPGPPGPLPDRESTRGADR